MKALLNLLKWFTLGTFVGLLLGMELRNGALSPHLIGTAAALTLATAGMCGLGILLMRKAHLV